MENRQVKIISNSDATVGINDPQVRISRTWERRGTVRTIDLDTLRELCYDPGTLAIFQRGILYIDDMEVKKELGLEPYEAKEPTNIIILNDQQKERYLKVMPFIEMKSACARLTKTEINNLVDYAIDHQIIDYDKCQYLKEITGRDIIKAIELGKLDTNV